MDDPPAQCCSCCRIRTLRSARSTSRPGGACCCRAQSRTGPSTFDKNQLHTTTTGSSTSGRSPPSPRPTPSPSCWPPRAAPAPLPSQSWIGDRCFILIEAPSNLSRARFARVKEMTNTRYAHLLLRSLWALTSSARSSSVKTCFFAHSSVGPWHQGLSEPALTKEILPGICTSCALA